MSELKFNWHIGEVIQNDNIEASFGGEIDLQNLKVPNANGLEIDEVEVTDVTLSAVPSGTIENLEAPKKGVNYQSEKDNRSFNLKMIESAIGLLKLIIISGVFIFVVVAISDICKGKIDLNSYISLIGYLISVFGTFLAGLGAGTYFSGKNKVDSG